MHRLSAPGGLAADLWVDEGLAVSSLRLAGAELLGSPGPQDIFGRRDVALGMALLHPWANRLAREQYAVRGRRADVRIAGNSVLRDARGLPIHGVTGRDPGWAVTQLDKASLTAERAWEPAARGYAAFPYDHVTRVRIQLDSNDLHVSTTLLPTGHHAVPAAFGWHPYLTPPGPHREYWTLECSHAPGDPMLLGGAAYDFGFATPPDSRLRLRAGEWSVTLVLERGFPYVQLYAPADRDVVCLEPMSAPTNALVSGEALPLVEPDQSFDACFRLQIRQPIGGLTPSVVVSTARAAGLS